MLTEMHGEQRTLRFAYIALALAVAAACLFLFTRPTYAQAELSPATATATRVGVAELDGSSKSVDRTSARAGSNLVYSVVLSNSSALSTTTVVMTDALPVEVDYIEGSLTIMTSGVVTPGFASVSDDVIVWQGTLGPQSAAHISFGAALGDDLAPGVVVTNTALIQGAMGEPLTRTATTSIVPNVVYLPVIFKLLPTPTLAPIAHPNSNNEWTVNWQSQPGVTSFELQESGSADFAAPTIYILSTSSKNFAHVPSPHNEYFYRVRAISGMLTSGWSNIESIVGAYQDNFDDASTGWSMRRTTYLEKVNGFYESGMYVVQVLDKWDWGIFSPLAKAPAPPYAIEFKNKAVTNGNLISWGLAFGGDWNGQPCPVYGTFEGIYMHTNCFNHFYNTNTINKSLSATIFKLQWERVDYLVWCLECGGSPMKRLSTNEPSWPLVEPIPYTSPDGWNTWRMEVRADGMKYFVNGQQFVSYNDASYVNDPYFGFFVSTDEYNNSTWQFDYITVMPLDQ